jgi:transcriptional regulator with XRE-family HTH domain
MELKIARRIARLSQQQLATRAGIDISTISRLESGERDVYGMSYRSVVHLAQALGVDPTELFPVDPLLPVLPRLIDEAVAPAEDPDAR